MAKPRSKKSPLSKWLSDLFRMSVVELIGFALGWVLQWCAKAAWRCRAGLMPIWWAVAFLVAGWAASWWPEFWPVPVSAGLAVASLLWFAGEQLSPHAQSMWLWLVPDGLDDGKPGVLDRPTERGYLCLLLLGGGAWLSARMQYGWIEDVQWALLALLAALGLPWWWHRGFRRRKPLNPYVRKWKRVNTNDDLKVWHGSTVVSAATVTNSTLLTVKLRGGRTVKHVGGDALILCSQLGLRPGAITVAQDQHSARRVLVRIVPRDPWTGVLLHPMPALRSLQLADAPKVLVGKYEDNTDDLFKISQHCLVCGMTGSGKSEWLQSLLAHLLSYRDVAVVAADLASGATFDVWDGVFAAPLATDLTSAWDLLMRVMALIEHRERKLAARRRAGELINVLPASEEDPALFFIIDEFPDLIKAAKQNGKDVVTMLERMANKARKVNIWLIFGLQNPTNDDAGSSILKGALTGVVGLGLSEHQSRNLWQSARAEGWDSAPLTVGTYLLRDRDREHQSPRVAKGLFLPPAERSRLIAAALRRPSLLSGEEGVILAGITSSPALGETARSGAYEEISPPVGEFPRLRVVCENHAAQRVIPQELDAVIHQPRGEEVTRGSLDGFTGRGREPRSAEFDERVYAEVPDSHQGGIGGTDLATQLGVSRDRVKRAFARLEKAGRVARNGDGTWSRPPAS